MFSRTYVIQVSMYVLRRSVRTYVCMYVCMCVYVCVCMYVCMYVCFSGLYVCSSEGIVLYRLQVSMYVL